MNSQQSDGPPVSADPPADQKRKHARRRTYRNFALHFRPLSVSERALDFALNWGLGVMATVLVFLLFASGLMLKFTYEPSLTNAYDSVNYLIEVVPFGQLLRNLHRWSANGLLFIVFLHFLRIFYTGAFTAPRQANWIVGLVLFAALVFSNFTGYLLPWDQLAYWAVTISTSMLDYIPVVGTGLREWILGGSEPGPKTLVNFYAIHTALLPALLLFFIPFHFWRIRKASGLVTRRTPAGDPVKPGGMVDSMPHQIMREAATAIATLAVVLLVSMFFNAPLDDLANPGLSPNPTKAPWYFMGVQEMLMHFHPVFALLVIPALLILGLISIPFWRYEATAPGVWFYSYKGRKMALAATVFSIVVTVGMVWLENALNAGYEAGGGGLVRNGLLPFVVLLTISAVFYGIMKKVFKADSYEMMQSMFTLVVTSFVVLTIIGVWFRGAGMQLGWAP